MPLNEIKPEDLHYYSDMDTFEFAAANRTYFEGRGVVVWDEMFARAERIFPTLPDRPRPYKRKNALEPAPSPVHPVRSPPAKRYYELTGEPLRILLSLGEKRGKDPKDVLEELIRNAK